MLIKSISIYSVLHDMLYDMYYLRWVPHNASMTFKTQILFLKLKFMVDC